MSRKESRSRNILAALAASLLLTACAAVDTAPDPDETVAETPVEEATPEPSAPELTPAPPVGLDQAGQAESLGVEPPESEIRRALPPAVAEEALTLERAVRLALLWHPSLEVATGRVSQQAEEVNVARAGYYPQVTGGINSGFERDGRDGWEPRLNINASQMLYDFGKVSSSVEAEQAATHATRAQLLRDVDGLIRDTSEAVIEVQRNQALLELAEAQIAGVRAIAGLVSERTGRGVSTRSDALQAEARVQAAGSTLLEIEAQLQRWQSTLANLVGQDAEEVAVGVPGWLLDACAAEEPNWGRVPALLEADARRREALARLEHSEAQLMPTVSLEIGVGYDVYQSSLSERRRSRDQPEFNIGVQVSTNLYDGGANQARRRAASHALRTSEATIRNTRLEVTRSLMEARAQIESLVDLLESLQARDIMMQQTRDLYRQQYLSLGTRTLLDLLNAEQELHQARFARANTVHDLRRLSVECLFNAGQARSAFGLEGTALRGMVLEP